MNHHQLLSAAARRSATPLMATIAALAASSMAGSLAGCGRTGDAPDAHTSGHAAETMADETLASGDRIDIPPAVRSNLGISFVRVERRPIERTLRVPGQFELQPTARREYRTMLPGRVELAVRQFDTVTKDQLLYRIDAPAWREHQQKLVEADAAIERHTTRLETYPPLRAAHERHEASLVESIGVWTERVEQLRTVRDAGGGGASDFAEARSALAAARAELADVQEKKAELDAARAETIAELDAGRARRTFLIDSATAITGMPPAELLASTGADEHGHAIPRWKGVDTIEVLASRSGVVESLGLTNGAWADEKTAVLTITRPGEVRFHAEGLQSDLGVLRDGLAARIVPPTPTTTGRGISLDQTMAGTLRMGLTGDAAARTVDLYVTPDERLEWARPGVAAQLEIVTDGTAAAELAIPLAALQLDGLNPVIFRRDPKNPNVALRLEADLGPDDGRWVSLLSGVREGDEIVLDGAFQLMLATSGSVQKGGHFHADGTYHEGEH
ncbi:MAG: efflux RND transporter periplasmic adaptor subunit [Phycisphaerales bacterium]